MGLYCKVECVAIAQAALPRPAELVSVAQALHWFDVEAFYSEVNRLAKPRDLIGYSQSGADIGDAFQQHAMAELQRLWGDPEIARTIRMPMSILAGPRFLPAGIRVRVSHDLWRRS